MPARPITPILISPRDEPLVCLQINAAWIPFLLGIVRPYQYPEQWSGELIENRLARLNAGTLLDILAESIGCDDPMSCCEITQAITIILHQVNPITLQLEVSVDGGQTWHPDPNSIPGQITEQPSPVVPGGSTTKCDAASNGKQHLEDWIAGVSVAFDNFGTLFEWMVQAVLVIAGIILWFIGSPAITPAELAVIEAIGAALKGVFDQGKNHWDNYWSSDERDKLLCALYCNIEDDGSFTDAGQQRVIQFLQSRLTNDVSKTLMIAMLGQIGRQGLNNMCSYGEAANSDCSSCSCGCDLSAWVIAQSDGEIISKTPFQIIVQMADRGDGHWGMAVRNPDIYGCCCHIEATYTPQGLSGEANPPNAVGWIACGTANDTEEFMNFSYSGGNTNRYDVTVPKREGETGMIAKIISTGTC